MYSYLSEKKQQGNWNQYGSPRRSQSIKEDGKCLDQDNREIIFKLLFIE